jgi:phytoene/squalene synthetase
LVTRAYSTSFSLGIRCLARRHHEPIYAIYGFVRLADEIVDTFHEYDKAGLLRRFREETFRSIEEGVSLNPVLHAFQEVVRQYRIPLDLIEAFLHSMEMDLRPMHYNDALYNEYIYGSAEVVGLMCLRVFCEGDAARYESLKPAARRLGAAFQKVNFLRDLRSDFNERGRVYFPEVDFRQFSEADKQRIEQDIAEDFLAAYEGIVRLPAPARFGVYVAYIYYLKLFDKIRRSPIERVLQERIRISNSRKFRLLVQSWFRYQLKTI